MNAPGPAADRPPLTYADVGATAGVLPGGYHHSRYRRTIGQGEQSFERAARALLGWQVHRRAGLRIDPGTEPAAVGRDVRMCLGVGRLALVIPCRVVYVVSDEVMVAPPGAGCLRRRGFAYGTLPGHPETGEERFVVELTPEGTVTFEMAVFSNAARWYTRAAGPLARVVQWIALRRYASACARLARVP